MLKFDTTCIKEDHLGYYVREINFSHLFLFNLLISTYLNPPPPPPPKKKKKKIKKKIKKKNILNLNIK